MAFEVFPGFEYFLETLSPLQSYKSTVLSKIFLKDYLFWKRLREQAKDRERGRENPKQAQHCQCRAQLGLEPDLRSIVQCSLNWLSHPGTPSSNIFIGFCFVFHLALQSNWNSFLCLLRCVKLNKGKPHWKWSREVGGGNSHALQLVANCRPQQEEAYFPAPAGGRKTFSLPW